MLGDAPVTMERGTEETGISRKFYQINKKSPACPMGFGQEDTVKRLWQEGHRLRKLAANRSFRSNTERKQSMTQRQGSSSPKR